jgi:hypothetical protein
MKDSRTQVTLKTLHNPSVRPLAGLKGLPALPSTYGMVIKKIQKITSRHYRAKMSIHHNLPLYTVCLSESTLVYYG